jgi:undecaprenyl-diphosphatase
MMPIAFFSASPTPDMDLFQAIIIAIIEGITEFLPVSSTGHMAIASALMGINKHPFTILYEIVIQFGAILAVVMLYWRKFFDFRKFSFYIKLVVAVIPALFFGAFFKSYIEILLEKPLVIASVLLGGGVLLLFVDRWFHKPIITNDERLTNRHAFIIGLYQVLAIVFPGLSRSAATIIGGMQQRLSRELAAEFSFYLAVPTMLAATVKSLYDVYTESPEVMGEGKLGILLTGCIVAFIVAALAIKFFIQFLQKNGFRAFGWYRIIIGIILLGLIFTGNLEG